MRSSLWAYAAAAALTCPTLSSAGGPEEEAHKAGRNFDLSAPQLTAAGNPALEVLAQAGGHKGEGSAAGRGIAGAGLRTAEVPTPSFKAQAHRGWGERLRARRVGHLLTGAGYALMMASFVVGPAAPWLFVPLMAAGAVVTMMGMKTLADSGIRIGR